MCGIVGYLDDGDIAVLTPSGYRIIDTQDHVQLRPVNDIAWDLQAIELGGYPHVMLKEICEQAETVRSTLRGRLLFESGAARLNRACGTSTWWAPPSRGRRTAGSTCTRAPRSASPPPRAFTSQIVALTLLGARLRRSVHLPYLGRGVNFPVALRSFASRACRALAQDDSTGRLR